MSSSCASSIDERDFRAVLGTFPTGVVVVTANGAEGQPAGLAIGSFTSVSLEPPLVAFLPDKRSTSFPAIRAAGRFCVNVLAQEQVALCRAFAVSGANKFDGVEWSPAPATGSPRLAGAVAWIDCQLDQVIDAGDHHIVLGRVLHLERADAPRPLLFFQGGYGGFAAPEPTAVPPSPNNQEEPPRA